MVIIMKYCADHQPQVFKYSDYIIFCIPEVFHDLSNIGTGIHSRQTYMIVCTVLFSYLQYCVTSCNLIVETCDVLTLFDV